MPWLSLLIALLLAILTMRGTQASGGARGVQPPQKTWIVLEHSTLDTRAVDFERLQSQLAGHDLREVLQHGSNRVAGVIVPVFDAGRCFYTTDIEPFKNSSGIGDGSVQEASLRAFLKTAYSQKVPVYLAVDVLGWQKTIGNPKREVLPRVFDKLLELREQGRYSSPSTDTTGYASPFNDHTRSLLIQLLQEIAQKYPEAAGVVLDLRLSDREILGFSTAARASAFAEAQIRPHLLGLAGTAEEVVTPPVRAWINWRRKTLTSLIKELATTYRKNNPNGRVIINGTADYYAMQDFNDLRTGQDWQEWTRTGEVDGVLLEGRWLSRFGDQRAFASFFQQDVLKTDALEHIAQDEVGAGNEAVADGEVATAKRAVMARSVAMIPVSNGRHLVSDSSYSRDWNTLKRGSSRLNQVAVVVRSETDLREAVALIEGRQSRDEAFPFRVGEVAPDWMFPDAEGKPWDSKALRKRNYILLLTGKETVLSKPFWNTLQRSVLTGNLPTPAAPAAAASVTPAFIPTVVALQNPPSQLINLIDSGGEMQFPHRRDSTVVTVDAAGFVRSVETISENGEMSVLLAKLGLTSDGQNVSGQLSAASGEGGPSSNKADAPRRPLEVGQPAPDFAMQDMNGNMVKLSDFRGKKNVLLTFFPKCFTGGCRNHLSSLHTARSSFQKYDTEILAVSIDAADVQIAFAKQWRLAFPLIPDPGRNLSMLYEAAEDTTHLAARQSIFIDKAGLISIIDRDVKVASHGRDVIAMIRDLELGD